MGALDHIRSATAAPTSPEAELLRKRYPSAAADMAVPSVAPAVREQVNRTEAEMLRHRYPSAFNADGTPKDAPPPPSKAQLAEQEMLRRRYPSAFPAEPAEPETPEPPKAAAPAGKEAATAELAITLPEGVEADPAALDEFKAVAREAGLSGEAASKLAAWEIQRQTKRDEAWAARGEAWGRELDSDPEIGGARRAETIQAVRTAIELGGGKEVISELYDMGLSNHPGLVRFLARVGRAFSQRGK